MKFGMITVCALTLVNVAQGAKYEFDTGHSGIQFKVTHLKIASVTGNFAKFTGKFQFDEKTGVMKDLTVTIDPSSVDTNEADRDKHLKGADFFDVEKHKEITFVGGETKLKEGKKVKLQGELSMRGVKKNVTFDFEYKGSVKDPWGNSKMVFEATTTINRKDFGINWNKTLDAGGLLVGEEVLVTVTGEAKA